MNSSSTQFQQIFDYSESLVSDQQNNDKGLSKEALLTSVQDFRKIFHSISDCQSFLDLGCGQGLGVIEFSKMFPGCWAGGVEFEKSRLEVAEKMAKDECLNNCHFIHGDLLTLEIPKVDLYFLYFATGPVLDRMLDYLGKQDFDFRIVAIESHGDLLARLKKERWLQLETEIPLVSPRHYPYAQVFRKCSKRSDDLHAISFKNKFLIFRQGHRLWVGDSLGLEWVRDDEFILKTPPRTIKENELLEVQEIEFFPPEVQKLIELRRIGILVFRTSTDEFKAEIRKIFFHPKIELELSTSEIVKWESVTKIFSGNSLCYDISSGFVF